MLGAGIFILTLCCGLLVWGTGKYLKTDWTPDFQKLKSTNNGNQLTAEMRDELMDGLSKMQQKQESSPGFMPWVEEPSHPSTPWKGIPKGAIMAFNLSTCPQWWSRFTEADGRFIMGSSSKGERGGSSSITLSTDQLPPHRHYIAGGFHSDTKDRSVNDRNGTISSYSATDFKDANDRYALRTTKKPGEANQWLTSTVGKWNPINIQNPYIKLLYCQKN